MKLLFIGDIVGEAATRFVAEQLPALRQRYQIDLTIANAENCAPSGVGMTVALVELLLRAGVDVITSGNHAWDGAEATTILAHPAVLRPLNMPAGVAGTGVCYRSVAGEAVTVVNIADTAALNRRYTPAIPADPLPIFASWEAIDKRGTVIVDFHGEHVIEKQTFAYAVDGTAAAILGTHTHEATLPLHLLPGGTALVTEVGMTGPLGGVQGFEPRWLVERLKQGGNAPIPPLRPVQGPLVLNAVVLDLQNGKTRFLERLSSSVE